MSINVYSIQLFHLLYDHSSSSFFFFFFFNDTATTEIYTLSLHDALPISDPQFTHREHVTGALPSHPSEAPLFRPTNAPYFPPPGYQGPAQGQTYPAPGARSEEHTSELQSHSDLVCRLLLEKKKKKNKRITTFKIQVFRYCSIVI